MPHEMPHLPSSQPRNKLGAPHYTRVSGQHAPFYTAVTRIIVCNANQVLDGLHLCTKRSGDSQNTEYFSL
jgi:hypothetical protein